MESLFNTSRGARAEAQSLDANAAHNPAPQSDRARKARWLPKSYAADENEEAAAILGIWNDVFKGVQGASAVQQNNMGNVRHVVRSLRSMRQSSPITLDIVRAAIKGYRENEGCKKLQSWKPFKSWFDFENITKYAGPDAFKKTPPPQTPAQLAAAKVVDHLGIMRETLKAHDKKVKLEKWIDTWLIDAARKLEKIKHDQDHPSWADFDRRQQYWQKLNLIYLRYCRLRRSKLAVDQDRFEALQSRARTIFETHFGKAPSASGVDVARLGAIEVALVGLNNELAERQCIARTIPPDPSGPADKAEAKALAALEGQP